MPSETDIYRAANLLIKQHGEDAPMFAAMSVHGLLAEGEKGIVQWCRIWTRANVA